MNTYETDASKILWQEAMKRNKIIYDNGRPVCTIPERVYSQEREISTVRRNPPSSSAKDNLGSPDTLIHRVLEDWDELRN